MLGELEISRLRKEIARQRQLSGVDPAPRSFYLLLNSQAQVSDWQKVGACNVCGRSRHGRCQLVTVEVG